MPLHQEGQKQSFLNSIKLKLILNDIAFEIHTSEQFYDLVMLRASHR